MPPHEPPLCRVTVHTAPLPTYSSLAPARISTRTAIPAAVAFMEWASAHHSLLCWLIDLVEVAACKQDNLTHGGSSMPQHLIDWTYQLGSAALEVLCPDGDGLLSIRRARMILADQAQRITASVKARFLLAKRTYVREKKAIQELNAAGPTQQPLPEPPRIEDIEPVADPHSEKMRTILDQLWSCLEKAVDLHGKYCSKDPKTLQRHAFLEHMLLLLAKTD